jgi:hypothetical protein
VAGEPAGDAASVFRLKQQVYSLKEQLRAAKAEGAQRLDKERRAWHAERAAMEVRHEGWSG